MVRNAPKWYEIHQNVSLGSNAVDRLRSLQKIPTRLCGTNFCSGSALFPPSFVRQQTVPNAPKWYEMHQKVNLLSDGVDRVHLLRKIPKWLRDTNFCTSLARFASSFVRQPNSPKCTKKVQFVRKQKFRVQRGGSGAFVAKNSNATSWHELSHQFCPFSIKCREPTKWSQLH